MLNFTDEERQADSNIRRKWFDVKENSLPSIYYLPLYEKINPTAENKLPDTPVKIRCARYERLPKRTSALKGMDTYEYKGDEYR